jgi:membrane glycosyltransferase
MTQAESSINHYSDQPKIGSTMRRILFFSLVILTTLVAMVMITSAFFQNGLSPQEVILLILYTLLILWVSTSFWTAIIGFVVILFGGDRHSIARLPARAASGSAESDSSLLTAVVMPIYNEDPVRVFAGLRAIYQSLRDTGREGEFELFILSDTRNADTWMLEETNWYRMCEDFDAHGRIFYRNREKNVSRKSGNIEDFCTRWGGRYRYMIVLDADSLISGKALTTLVDLMEAHPQVGLIQSPPLPVNHKSLFARILQFGSSLYSDVFMVGSSWWLMSESNYWGHNAIIRIKPFVEHCGLPKLPGKEPFGGEILSHDFVEAALLKKAGWEVWLDYEIKESFEELPPTLIDYAKRDRRWCQGNLQHMRMILARGFSGISRLHMLMGIMSYLSSPLWLLFLVFTGFEAYVQSQTVPVYFFGDNFYPVWPESYAVEMTTVLLVTLTMLFSPKLLGLLLVYSKPERVRSYGGYIRVTLSVILESLFSMLTAPILMLYQSKFVVAILLRRSVGWPPQNRDDHRLSLREAILAHGGQSLVGIIAGLLSYEFVPSFFWWFTPVLGGLVLAVPVSIISSSTHVGKAARKLGFFLTPEEYSPPKVIEYLQDNLATTEAVVANLHADEKYGVLADPGACALHLALLPHRETKKRIRHELMALLYRVIEEGPEKLSSAEKRALVADPDSLMRLHTLAWCRREGTS